MLVFIANSLGWQLETVEHPRSYFQSSRIYASLVIVYCWDCHYHCHKQVHCSARGRLMVLPFRITTSDFFSLQSSKVTSCSIEKGKFSHVSHLLSLSIYTVREQRTNQWCASHTFASFVVVGSQQLLQTLLVVVKFGYHLAEGCFHRRSNRLCPMLLSLLEELLGLFSHVLCYLLRR